MSKKPVAVFIGRMQPPHLAHIKIIKSILSNVSHKLIICLGSADCAPNIKNPWTAAEREEFIRSELTSNENRKVYVEYVSDHLYNNQRWIEEIQQCVYTYGFEDNEVVLVGHIKDQSSSYLNDFPQWTFQSVPNIQDMHSTDIRRILFNMDPHDINEFDDALGQFLPFNIANKLKAYMLSEMHTQMRLEQTFIQKYKQKWNTIEYPPVFVTVDAVVIQSGHVLLVKRRSLPGKGLFALPGGFVEQSEVLVDAMIRELREETKIKVPVPVLRGSIRHQQVFDHPDRSLRGRTITHAYHIELNSTGTLPKIKGSSDAEKAKWIPLHVFKKMRSMMFEDHYDIIEHFVGV